MQALFWARYQSGLRAEGNKQNGPLLLIRVSDLISEKYLVEEIYGELLQTSPLCTASSFPPAVFAFKFSFQCATAESSREKSLFTGQESAFQQPWSLFFSASARIYYVSSMFAECQFASQISYSSCVCHETIVIFPHALKSIYSMYIHKHRVYTD